MAYLEADTDILRVKYNQVLPIILLSYLVALIIFFNIILKSFLFVKSLLNFYLSIFFN